MSSSPQKKGKLAQDDEGNTVLVNSKGEAFEADPVIIEIWNSFDGDLTVEQLAEDVEKESGKNKEDLVREINDIIETLQKVNLIRIPSQKKD